MPHLRDLLIVQPTLHDASEEREEGPGHRGEGSDVGAKRHPPRDGKGDGIDEVHGEEVGDLTAGRLENA